jgi:hypothetical protein
VLAQVPATVSLPSSSTRSGSQLPSMVVPTSTSTSQGDNKKKSNAGAIAGGVIGGLAALAVIGVGVWFFLRKRATRQGDGDYSDYTRVSTGAPMSEPGVQSSNLRLYVRFYHLIRFVL